MRFRYFREALEEIREASLHYGEISERVRKRFHLAMSRALEEIGSYPQAWSKSIKGTRRRNLRRFPYTVVYQAKAEEIVIIAVAHLARRQNYWRDRL